MEALSFACSGINYKVSIKHKNEELNNRMLNVVTADEFLQKDLLPTDEGYALTIEVDNLPAVLRVGNICENEKIKLLAEIQNGPERQEGQE